MTEHRIFTMPFSAVYPAYVNKAERKGRTKEEVDRVICWLTGYDHAELDKLVDELAKGKPWRKFCVHEAKAFADRHVARPLPSLLDATPTPLA